MKTLLIALTALPLVAFANFANNVRVDIDISFVNGDSSSADKTSAKEDRNSSGSDRSTASADERSSNESSTIRDNN